MRWLGLGLLALMALPTTPIAVGLVLAACAVDGWVAPFQFPAWWLNTSDDPSPDQGMYEPFVAWVYRWCGWWIKTWYWLGIRNQLYGLFAALCPRYDGSKVAESTFGPLKIYSAQGFSEITWPLRRVSFGYKVHTLKTAKLGDPIWWVCMPAFWKSREY